MGSYQTRTRRNTLKNYIEGNTDELITSEIENEKENNFGIRTLTTAEQLRKKQLDTNRNKFKVIMKAGRNLTSWDIVDLEILKFDASSGYLPKVV